MSDMQNTLQLLKESSLATISKFEDVESCQPDFQSSETFDVVNGITRRLTPFRSLYILDFIWPDGKRVEDNHIFAVWDMGAFREPPARLPTAGSMVVEGCNVQLYYICAPKRYEVRSLHDEHVVRKISFEQSLAFYMSGGEDTVADL